MSRQKHDVKFGYVIERRYCKVSPDNFRYFLPDCLLTLPPLYSMISKECKRSHERKTAMINTIDISGKWELFISENNRTSLPDNYNDSIILPDTLSDAAKVAENKNRDEG